MRNFKDFSAGEWLRLMPLKLAFKQLRNDAWLALYKKLKPESLGGFLKESERFKDRDIILIVAFEQPWALDWLLRMAESHLTDTAILVFDNSRRAAARQEIKQVCQNHATPYLALPPNPTRHVNRSHGMAMTWIFHNVVRVIKPRLFAYIDHDMIPIRKVEFAERLGGQPFYGLERSAGSWAWNLWAGYCMFDFAQVGRLPMNFLYDFSRGLDTGGRNWVCLYRNFDQSSLRFASNSFVDIRDPATGTSRSVQLVDDRWFHIGGIGYNDNFRSKMEFCKNVAQALDRGTSWTELYGGDSAGR